MFEYIKGTVDKLKPSHIILEANSIGYFITISLNTFTNLNGKETVKLYIHQVIREDAHLLYGFIDQHERALFRTLLKVNGVGPKIALAILSSIEPDAFVRCVEDQNTTALQRLPGIGKKTAERLSLELRDKVSKLDHLILHENFSDSTVRLSLVQAIRGLGYSRSQSEQAIGRLNEEELSSLPLEELIKKTLTALMGSKMS
jgi:holliday junction DNA helicase RuvA